MIDVERCIASGIPFAVWRDPSGAVSDSTRADVTVFPWLASEGLSINNARPQPISTLDPQPQQSHDAYCRCLDELIGRLKVRGGKTVYSRTCQGVGGKSPREAYKALMSLEQPALRIMWYHPQSGLWLASTPEILLDVDMVTRRFRTMALAGTRSVRCEHAWDEKNCEEQQMVVDTICSDLRTLGLSPEVSPCFTLASGMVEHRCTIIEGNIGDMDPRRVASTLSPTPALGGFPRHDAIADIQQLELNPRECYGGYIAIADERRWRAYVILRCARMDCEGNFRLFGGGGITSRSIPESEWLESEAKMGVIAQCLTTRP